MTHVDFVTGDKDRTHIKRRTFDTKREALRAIAGVRVSAIKHMPNRDGGRHYVVQVAKG